jgi:hypothetical protein
MFTRGRSPRDNWSNHELRVISLTPQRSRGVALSVARHEITHAVLWNRAHSGTGRYAARLLNMHKGYTSAASLVGGSGQRHTLGVEKRAWAGAIKLGRGNINWGTVHNSIRSYGGNLRDMAALVRYARMVRGHHQRTARQRRQSAINGATGARRRGMRRR